MELQTEGDYNQVREKIDRYNGAREELFPGHTAITPAMAEELPEPPTNEETSAVETWEWNHNPPERYFAYVREDGGDPRQGTLITWTGQRLGNIRFGHQWVSNFGDKRVSIEVKGTNGRTYYGTYFKSAGDYCRLTQKKAQCH